MDKFGGVVILNESCLAQPDASPSTTKVYAVTPERAKKRVSVCCVRGTLELVILFYGDKSTSDPRHTQPNH